MGVSIPLEQGNVFRHNAMELIMPMKLFQSLWNRAMSFDSQSLEQEKTGNDVSIPLEQGNVFRLATTVSATESGIQVSIPLEQGNVFRHYYGTQC